MFFCTMCTGTVSYGTYILFRTTHFCIYSCTYSLSAYMNLELITWHGRIGLRSGVDPVPMTAGLCPTLYVSSVKIGPSFIQP
jgi:hypothetical protein